MVIALDSESERQIGQCLRLLQSVLGGDLLGLYLYGSAVLGGLHPYSDIDLLAVTGRATTAEEKRRLASEMLHISGVYLQSEKKPLELTLVVRGEVNPWRYPPAFDFQYGDWLRGAFEQGVSEPWPSKLMPDLAVLITQVRLACRVVWGPPPERLLVEVPAQDVRRAASEAVVGLLADLESDTRNVLLTLARIWFTLATNAICSKAAAADWAIERLPEAYRGVMQRARDTYLGLAPRDWAGLEGEIGGCAACLVQRIEESSTPAAGETSIKVD